MGRTRRSRRTQRSGPSQKNEGKANQSDVDVDVSDTEISIGFESAGFEVGLTVGEDGVILSLGIGIASVEYNLTEPNNSTVGYVFDIFEISGERDGCTVTLEYTIKGQLVKTETRTIPECEEEEEEEPSPEPELGEEIEEADEWKPGERDINFPPGDPLDVGMWLLGYFHQVKTFSFGPASSTNYTFNANSSVVTNTNVGFNQWHTRHETVSNYSYFPGDAKYNPDGQNEFTFISSSERTMKLRPRLTSWSTGGVILTISLPGSSEMNLDSTRIYAVEGYRWFMEDHLKTRVIKSATEQKNRISRETFLDYNGNLTTTVESLDDDTPLSWYYLAVGRSKVKVLAEALAVKQPNFPRGNPPPLAQKRKPMDKCCRMVAGIWKILNTQSILKEKIKIPKRWIDRRTKNPEFDPKDAKTYEELKTITDVMFTKGMLLDLFEELFNPAGEESAFPLKADQANWLARMMGVSGGNYKYPDPDDDRKPEENRQIKPKDLPINGYMDIFRYLLESQIRLENVLPYAEMSDSEIEKRLLWPKHQGTQKLHNLLQVQEALFLYLNNVIGDPTKPIIVKDSNPAIEGDQPLTTEFFNLSDIARKTYRMNIDTAQDVDLGNNFAKRSLYELLIIHQTIVTVHEMCEAIMEDLDFKEIQEMIQVPMAADPYAGRRNDDGTFTPDEKLDENTEEAVEENLDLFLRQSLVNVKVSRKDPAETTSLRDLVAQIGRYAAEAAAANKLAASPEAIQAAIDAARAAVQTQSALTRLDVQQALTGGRYRQKKRKNR